MEGIDEIMGPCDVTCDVTSDVTSTRPLFQRVFGRFGARQWPQGYGFGYEAQSGAPTSNSVKNRFPELGNEAQSGAPTSNSVKNRIQSPRKQHPRGQSVLQIASEYMKKRMHSVKQGSRSM